MLLIIGLWTVPVNIKYVSLPEESEPRGLPVSVASCQLLSHNLNHYRFLPKMCTAASEESGYLGTLLSGFAGMEDTYPREQHISVQALFVGSGGTE